MDSELRILIFLNSGPPECQKNSGGAPEKIKNQSQLSSNQESPLSAFSDGHFSSRHQSITLREAKISRCMSWGKLLLCLMCLKIRGFQIDNCIFKSCLNFVNLKCQLILSVGIMRFI